MKDSNIFKAQAEAVKELNQRLATANQALASAVARLARVEGLIDDWESYGGPGTDCERVFGEQKVSVEFVVSKVREALK